MIATTDYGYLAFDLLTGDVLGDLELTGAKARWVLNDPGDLGDAAAPLGDLTSVQRQEIRAMTVPWHHGIAMTRNGQIIKAACITTRRYSSSSGSYRFGTTGLLGYWRRRVIARNLTWASVDQFDIVRQLLALGGTTIPLTMPSDDSGVVRDRTLSGGDLKPVLDAILELADNIQGFDIGIDTVLDPDATITPRVKHLLQLDYPALGTTVGGAGGLMLIEWPTNTIGGYEWAEDGGGWATHIFGASQTDAGVNLVRLYINHSLLDAGFPRIDLPLTFSNIADVATLDDHIKQAAAEATGFSTLPAFTVPDDDDTAAGLWAVGDHVRVRITDDRRWPAGGGVIAPGLDIVLRLQEATLDPATRQTTMTMAPIIVPVT